MPDSIVNAYEESDVLDPRTDAERPSVPPVIKPVDLGPVHVETPVVLSPMAGVTNWPFRVICESYGPDGLYVAEMITARALVASLQLYGVNPSIVEQAAKIVIDENMADHVDLNFGCPVPKVTRRGGRPVFCSGSCTAKGNAGENDENGAGGRSVCTGISGGKCTGGRVSGL